MRQSRRQVLAAAGISLLGGCTSLRNAVSGDEPEKTPPTPFLTEPADWEYPNYDAANTNAAPEYAGPKRVSASPKWTAALSAWQFDHIEGPVVADGHVYLTVNGYEQGESYQQLVAFDARTGRQQWQRTTDNELHVAQPVVAGETVFWSTPSAGVLALNAVDGTEKWSHESDNYTQPLPAHGLVLTVSGTSETSVLTALRPDTGAVYWSREESTPRWYPVAADDEVFYVLHYRANQPDELHAIDPLTGETHWTVAREVYWTPAVTDTHLYSSAGRPDAKQLSALNTTTQRVEWSVTRDLQLELGERFVNGRQPVAAVTDEFALVHVDFHGYKDDRIEARDVDTGDIVWERQAAGDVPVSYTSPVVAGENVYVVARRESEERPRSSTLHVLALDDGREKQQVELDGYACCKPTVADGTLFIPLLRPGTNSREETLALTVR